MAGNFVQEGKHLTHTAGADVASGGVVVMGEVVGVALNAIANGESGAVATEGVFNLACLSTDVVAQGDVVYWDATESRLTTTAGTHKCAGYAAASSANGVATCDVKLNAFTVAGA